LSTLGDPSDHDWPFYCEENIWHRCGGALGQREGASVLFVSNARRSVAIWQQRKAGSATEPVLWDYHVIGLAREGNSWQIYDPDSTLGVPVEVATYLDAAFQPLAPSQIRYAPRFRWLSADLYRREFRSDRSHMRDATGAWLQPPPPTPCIGEGSNLMRFVDTETRFLGEVLDLAELRARVCTPG